MDGKTERRRDAKGGCEGGELSCYLKISRGDMSYVPGSTWLQHF